MYLYYFLNDNGLGMFKALVFKVHRNEATNSAVSYKLGDSSVTPYVVDIYKLLV